MTGKFFIQSESLTTHRNQMKIFPILTAATTLAGPLALTSPAFAERPGHKYVWTSATYTVYKPGMSIGGNVSCYGNSYVNCYKSPTFTSGPREYQQTLAVHVDCTDRTYDAKGDRQGWKSWNHAPNLYRQFVYACS